MSSRSRLTSGHIETWSIVFALALSGCASVFNLQVLYEAPQPKAKDSRYVIRLEKEQNPLTGAKDVYPVRAYNISEAQIREMMSGMYRRFFKDPATFVPPREESETVVGDMVDIGRDLLFGEKKKKKNTSGSYTPQLNEGGHPASMTKPKPLFTPEEIDALAPEVAKALEELRKGEHLTLRTKSYDSQGRGGRGWTVSEDATSVAIRFQSAGRDILGMPRKAEIHWDFYEVDGLEFRGLGGKSYTYWSEEGGFREEYDFLAVFPRPEGSRQYWEAEFPLE